MAPFFCSKHLLYKFLVTQNGGRGVVHPTLLIFMFGYDWKEAGVAGRALPQSDELCSSPVFQH